MNSRPVKIDVPQDQVRHFCQKWKVAELSLFGSVLRDDFRPDSDVDVLISFTQDARWSLFDWLDMIDELRVVFGRDVDLLSSRALRNPYRRQQILSACEVLFAA